MTSLTSKEDLLTDHPNSGAAQALPSQGRQITDLSVHGHQVCAACWLTSGDCSGFSSSILSCIC